VSPTRRSRRPLRDCSFSGTALPGPRSKSPPRASRRTRRARPPGSPKGGSSEPGGVSGLGPLLAHRLPHLQLHLHLHWELVRVAPGDNDRRRYREGLRLWVIGLSSGRPGVSARPRSRGPRAPRPGARRMLGACRRQGWRRRGDARRAPTGRGGSDHGHRRPAGARSRLRDLQPLMADPDTIERLLESGKNVVTPLGWFYRRRPSANGSMLQADGAERRSTEPVSIRAASPSASPSCFLHSSDLSHGSEPRSSRTSGHTGPRCHP